MKISVFISDCKSDLMRKPRAVVFDVPIDDVSCDELIQFIVDTCISENKSIVANVNVYALNQAYQLPRFREFLTKLMSCFVMVLA